MRHRKRGRTLGRSPSHRKALLRNLASSLFLTERDELFYEDLQQPDGQKVNPPAEKGRIVTTLEKAKEVKPLVERCITIARRSLVHNENAQEHATDAERRSDDWESWRNSDAWNKWNSAIAPVLAARRRCLKLLGNKEAVEVLFDDIAERYADRDGGYTRVLRLATPRLGDAGTRAILELVGKRDRVQQKSEMPDFNDEQSDDGSNEPQSDTEAADTAATVTEDPSETADGEADDVEVSEAETGNAEAGEGETDDDGEGKDDTKSSS